MSKKAEIRQQLNDLEEELGIPRNITLSDEDRLIKVVVEQQKQIRRLVQLAKDDARL